MTVTEISAVLRGIFGESQPWDNDGVMVESGLPVTKIAVCLDATTKNISVARAQGANAIITHHPLIFKPISSFNGDATSRRVYQCIKNNISVASFHTCFDTYNGGVNDLLCERLEISEALPFVPYGRIGSVTPRSFEEFSKFAEERLSCVPFQTVNSNKTVSKVAVVGGCGKDEVTDAYLAGADTFLTGEASHAAMIEAEEYGMNLLCLGHFQTENIAVPALAEIIKSNFPHIEVITIGV